MLEAFLSRDVGYEGIFFTAVRTTGIFCHPTCSAKKGASIPMATSLVLDTIAQVVSQALDRARSDGLLQLETMPDIMVDRPGKPENGDFSTNLPLRLARATRINPLELAEELVRRIVPGEQVERVVAAPPGFINFSLSPAWLAQQVEVVRSAGAAYGDTDLGEGRRVQVEFVSVNPTGPLHVGHARGAVLGSALANILEAAGYVRKLYDIERIACPY